MARVNNNDDRADFIAKFEETFPGWTMRPDGGVQRTDAVLLRLTTEGRRVVWYAAIPTRAEAADGVVFVCLDNRWDDLEDAMRAIGWWFPVGTFSVQGAPCDW